MGNLGNPPTRNMKVSVTLLYIWVPTPLSSPGSRRSVFVRRKTDELLQRRFLSSRVGDRGSAKRARRRHRLGRRVGSGEGRGRPSRGVVGGSANVRLGAVRVRSKRVGETLPRRLLALGRVRAEWSGMRSSRRRESDRPVDGGAPNTGAARKAVLRFGVGRVEVVAARNRIAFVARDANGGAGCEMKTGARRRRHAGIARAEAVTVPRRRHAGNKIRETGLAPGLAGGAWPGAGRVSEKSKAHMTRGRRR